MQYFNAGRSYPIFSSRLILPLLWLSCVTLTLSSQPSGGPYGPLPQRYTVPKTKGTVYYVAPEGKEMALGRTIDDPATLEAVFKRVKTGDVVILRGGTYRTGNLILNQGIILQPYEDEEPVLKGTMVATNWRKLGNGLWITKWDHLFPDTPEDWWRRERNARTTPLHRFNNDMVFVDGRFLQSAGWAGEVDENSFYIDYKTGEVYIGVDPSDRLIEITAFDVALHRITDEYSGRPSDKMGPVLRGIHFTQYAYRAIEIEGTDPEGISPETNHGKEVTGTLIEHCSFTYCSRVAAYLRGDHLTVRHCMVNNTSTEGLFILSSSDVLLEKNIFSRNNIENITGYFPAAVKIFNQCYRVTCNDNLVTDLPNSNGIWYDVGNVDGVFTNNWVENVGRTNYLIKTDRLWPSDNGFYFEISKGVTCAGNVFVNCDHGVSILNSSGAKIYNNTFFNSMACIGRNARSAIGDHFDWHPATGPGLENRNGHVFVNNLMCGDEHFDRPFVFIWQDSTVCSKTLTPDLVRFDHNLYIRSRFQEESRLMLWCPAENESCRYTFYSMEEVQKVINPFEQNSRLMFTEPRGIFQSPEFRNFHTVKDLPLSVKAAGVPAEVERLMMPEGGNVDYVGAYPED
jgi:parallel beta-helix repeat protein